ncbi:hypothetical protein ABHF33_02995 [Chitinibacter sp. FCG-7]|uniref:Uncharacterized protein n=1 Tax=Chitinibacter mangrovi TaxID=3153927 RepID=A0AAU7FC76_9NEIS
MTNKSYRLIALTCITLTLVLQCSVAALSSCEVKGLFIAGSITLIPALIYSLSPKPWAGIGAACGAAPFLIWANYVECFQTYQGGGAAMAYVLVWFIGIPTSMISGGLTVILVMWLQKKCLNTSSKKKI